MHVLVLYVFFYVIFCLQLIFLQLFLPLVLVVAVLVAALVVVAVVVAVTVVMHPPPLFYSRILVGQKELQWKYMVEEVKLPDDRL